MAKSNPKTFGYCSACGCHMRIDGTCRICGDTDQKPTAKPKVVKKRKKREKAK